VLWGRFFASGRFAPIRELTALLAYHVYKDVPEEYRKLAEKPAEPPTGLSKGIVFRAVIWSLGSNIEQDKVVRDYCEGILLRRELPGAEHGWLATIFRAAFEKSQQGTTPAPAGKGR